jgi:hypothetical protein
MYSAVNVQSLSEPQISRLLNHHGVRLQLGGPLELHLSKEQMKKLKRAEKKGGGAVITFDPFQSQIHQHLKGKSGRGSKLVDQSFTGNDVAHFIGAKESSEPIMNKAITLNQVKDAGNRAKRFFGLGVTGNEIATVLGANKSSQSFMNKDITKQDVENIKDFLKDKETVKSKLKEHSNDVKQFLGLGVKKRGRPKKGGDIVSDLKKIGNDIKKAFKPENINREIHDNFLYPVASELIHKGIPMTTRTLGGIAGTMMTGGPVGGLAGSFVGEELGQLASNEIGKQTGLGVKKKSRSKKISVGKGQKGRALFEAGRH